MEGRRRKEEKVRETNTDADTYRQTDRDINPQT